MEKLKEILSKIIEDETSKSSVEIHEASLEAALQKAADELGVDISQLDYEIKEFGGKGLFGLGKKDFVVNVYKTNNAGEIYQNIMSEQFGEESEPIPIVEDRNSEAFVRVTSRGVLLKVTPPSGEGTRITEPEVLNKIANRGVKDYDAAAVKKIIKQAAGEYMKIGEMPINVLNDSTASVQISTDDMKAFLVITPPKQGGYDLELEDIYTILKNNSVVVGLKDDALNRLIDYPVYNEAVLVAEGIKPVNGADAELEYQFNTSTNIRLTEAEGGKVDFKNISNVENVTAGQLLATKKDPTRGEPGRTVKGELIPQKMGKDFELVAGKNTHIEGNCIIADVSGQVILSAGKVNVEQVMTVNGDVNLKSGNIDFVGSVVVTGNVEDGFDVKAAGNIMIHGTVGRSNIEADGDVIINQGVMGKNEGFIKAGKNVSAKFLENVKIDAGETVTVQDSVMHCFIDVKKSLLVTGKRAAIVGGHIRAGELISTKQIGSVSGTETVLEVGFDPKMRQQLQELETAREQYYKEQQTLEPNLANLEYMKKTAKQLSDEKEELLQKMIEESAVLKSKITKNQQQIDEINEHFMNLQSEGRIIASKIAYPGIVVYIRNSYLKAKTEYKKSVFLLRGTEVDVEAYVDEAAEAAAKGKTRGRRR